MNVIKRIGHAKIISLRDDKGNPLPDYKTPPPPPPIPEPGTVPVKEYRRAAIKNRIATGKMAGRQEGFIIMPEEIIGMLERAESFLMAKRKEVRNPRQYMQLLLGFSFGIRVTDLMVVTWDQVLNHPSFRIQEIKKKRFGKRRSRRIVSVPPQTRDKARFIYENTPDHKRHPHFVFGKLGRRGAERTMERSLAEPEEVWAQGSFCDSFKRACRRFGTEGLSKHASFSCCRPSYARWRFELIREATGDFGTALAALQKELGHATPMQTTTYLKLVSGTEGVQEHLLQNFMNFDREKQPSLSVNYPGSGLRAEQVYDRNQVIREKQAAGRWDFERESDSPPPPPLNDTSRFGFEFAFEDPRTPVTDKQQPPRPGALPPLPEMDEEKTDLGDSLVGRLSEW